MRRRRAPLWLLAFLTLGAAAFDLVVVDHAFDLAVAAALIVVVALAAVGAATLVARVGRSAGAGVATYLGAFAVLFLAVAGVLVARFPEVTGTAIARRAQHFGVARATSSGGGSGAIARTPRSVVSAVLPPPQPSSLPGPQPPSSEVGRFSAGDASYTEPGVCDSLADVTSLAQGYDASKKRATVEALARARYSQGLPFLQAQTDVQLDAWFLHAPDSFEGLASRFDAAVHEGSHIWGIKHFDPRTVSYPVRGDLTIKTLRLQNFNRSEIVSQHVDAARDPYVRIYLEGASGAQGFNALLDEFQAYAHSLASRYCTRDLLAPGTRVSARDGILTMMYYVETYLAIAQAKHPHDYAAIIGDAGHRELILAVWNRAEFWLRKAADIPTLGVGGDTRMEALVYDPRRLAELTRIKEKTRPSSPPP